MLHGLQFFVRASGLVDDHVLADRLIIPNLLVFFLAPPIQRAPYPAG